MKLDGVNFNRIASTNVARCNLAELLKGCLVESGTPPMPRRQGSDMFT